MCRGGGVVKGCDGSGAASGTYRCEHYGCVVAHQRANYNVMYPSGVYDSTLVHTTGSQFALYVTGQDCPVRNTVVIGSTNNDNTQNSAAAPMARSVNSNIGDNTSEFAISLQNTRFNPKIVYAPATARCPNN